jgi:hypothetical protein
MNRQTILTHVLFFDCCWTEIFSSDLSGCNLCAWCMFSFLLLLDWNFLVLICLQFMCSKQNQYVVSHLGYENCEIPLHRFHPWMVWLITKSETWLGISWKESMTTPRSDNNDCCIMLALKSATWCVKINTLKLLS